MKVSYCYYIVEVLGQYFHRKFLNLWDRVVWAPDTKPAGKFHCLQWCRPYIQHHMFQNLHTNLNGLSHSTSNELWESGYFMVPVSQINKNKYVSPIQKIILLLRDLVKIVLKMNLIHFTDTSCWYLRFTDKITQEVQNIIFFVNRI